MWTPASTSRGTHTSPFGFPEDPAAEAEVTARRVAHALAVVRAEAADARCECHVLGPVASVMPHIVAELEQRGLSRPNVWGMWAVPPSLVCSATQPRVTPWRSVRERLKPYVAHDLWPEISEAIAAGGAIDWRDMALDPASVVVIKRRVPLLRVGTQLARDGYLAVRSGRAHRATLAAVRANLHKSRLSPLASSIWPFRWSWLIGWCVTLIAVVGSRLLAESILLAHAEDVQRDKRASISSGWRGIVALLFGNLTVIAYASRGREPYDRLIEEATHLKEAGSKALRLGDYPLAIKEYIAGAQRAGDARRGMWWLNRGALLVADRIRAACLNNAAAAYLKEDHWTHAEEACTAVLALDIPEAWTGAKAHYRRALARASLENVEGAKSDLLAAERLVPGDRHVDALLRTLQYGTRRDASGETHLKASSGRVGATNKRESARLPSEQMTTTDDWSCSPLDSTSTPATSAAPEREGASCVVHSQTSGLSSTRRPCHAHSATAHPTERPTGDSSTAASTQLLPHIDSWTAARDLVSKGGSTHSLQPEQRFGWAREWFQSQLVRLCPRDAPCPPPTAS